jgi:hypothetical protein
VYIGLFEKVKHKKKQEHIIKSINKLAKPSKLQKDNEYKKIFQNLPKFAKIRQNTAKYGKK